MNLARIFFALFAAHMLVLSGICYVRQAEPHEQLQLSLLNQTLILSGRSFLGQRQMRGFKNYAELSNYLKAHHLQLLSPCSACQRSAQEIEIHSTEDGSFKVRWTQNENQKFSLQAPDFSSAKIFAEFLQFEGLHPSYLGFSIPVQSL